MIQQNSTYQQGNQVGEYIIEEMIGKGGFGQVYKAYRGGDLNEAFALKILNLVELQDKEVENLNEEIKNMEAIKSINVVKFFKVLQSNTQCILIMELCKQSHLIQQIDNIQTIQDLQDINSQILCGLIDISLLGIVHRDLKLDNILVDDNVIKISDFGYSQNVSQNTLMSSECGTPEYCAPEILIGCDYYDYQVDIWSFGVCIFVMVYQRFPFKDETCMLRLMYQKWTLNEPDNQMMTPQLKDLLQQIFVYNPKQRMNYFQLLNHPYFKTMKGEKFDYMHKQISETRGYFQSQFEKMFQIRASQIGIKTKEIPQNSPDTSQNDNSEVHSFTNVKPSEIGTWNTPENIENSYSYILTRSAIRDKGQKFETGRNQLLFFMRTYQFINLTIQDYKESYISYKIFDVSRFLMKKVVYAICQEIKENINQNDNQYEIKDWESFRKSEVLQALQQTIEDDQIDSEQSIQRLFHILKFEKNLPKEDAAEDRPLIFPQYASVRNAYRTNLLKLSKELEQKSEEIQLHDNKPYFESLQRFNLKIIICLGIYDQIMTVKYFQHIFPDIAAKHPEYEFNLKYFTDYIEALPLESMVQLRGFIFNTFFKV